MPDDTINEVVVVVPDDASTPVTNPADTANPSGSETVTGEIIERHPRSIGERQQFRRFSRDYGRGGGRICCGRARHGFLCNRRRSVGD